MPAKSKPSGEYVLVKKSVLEELIRTIEEMRMIIKELREAEDLGEETVKSK